MKPAQSADLVPACVAEFDRAMVCLRLELPDAVWQDVYRMWAALRTLIDGDRRG